MIVPQWVQELGEKDATNNPLLKAEKWKLLKCLPGQRNAALMWIELFKELVEKAGFQSYKGTPTVFKHVEKTIFMMIHVDDVLVT